MSLAHRSSLQDAMHGISALAAPRDTVLKRLTVMRFIKLMIVMPSRFDPPM